MDEKLAALAAIGFRSVPASEANAAIAEMREACAAEGAPARSYELVVPAQADWAWLLSGPLGKLVYHLESTQARPPACGGVVVSLFAGDRLHFVRAGEFVAGAARLAGLSVDELFARHGTGELRTAARDPQSPPLLLGKG